jgi:hypothetical protein
MASEELKARTKAFALRVIKLVDAMPRSLAAQVIGIHTSDFITIQANEQKALPHSAV